MKERGYKGEKKELFWIFLTTMAILLIIAVIANISPPGATGHFIAVQNIAYLKAGNELPMAVKNVKGMHLANFELLEDIKNGQITFEEDGSIAFDGTAYSKFRVSATDEDKIGKIEITMKIKQADLKEIGLAPEDVALYVNGKEERTRIDRTEGEYEFYTASTEEFGEYVIGRMREEELPKEPIAPPQVVGKALTAPEELSEELIEVVVEEPAEREPAAVEGQAEEIGFFGKIINFFKKWFNPIN